ncbi:MAG TPA: hypothetical protein VGD14_03025, partial [bacterium]
TASSKKTARSQAKRLFFRSCLVGKPKVSTTEITEGSKTKCFKKQNTLFLSYLIIFASIAVH